MVVFYSTEFHDWKETMEKKTKSSYVACKEASKKLNGYSQTFYCNRSGYARLVSDDQRQRAPQAQGGYIRLVCKTDDNCLLVGAIIACKRPA